MGLGAAERMFLLADHPLKHPSSAVFTISLFYRPAQKETRHPLSTLVPCSMHLRLLVDASDLLPGALGFIPEPHGTHRFRFMSFAVYRSNVEGAVGSRIVQVENLKSFGDCRRFAFGRWVSEL